MVTVPRTDRWRSTRGVLFAVLLAGLPVLRGQIAEEIPPYSVRHSLGFKDRVAARPQEARDRKHPARDQRIDRHGEQSRFRGWPDNKRKPSLAGLCDKYI